MPTACPLRSWEDCLLQKSLHRLSPVVNWLRDSTIWGLQFLSRILPYMVEEESFTWQATMTVPRLRSVSLQKISVFHQSNLAGYRKADCLCRRTEIAGAN